MSTSSSSSSSSPEKSSDVVDANEVVDVQDAKVDDPKSSESSPSKFTYSKDELIAMSKLPSSLALPTTLYPNMYDEKTRLWAWSKSSSHHDRPKHSRDGEGESHHQNNKSDSNSSAEPKTRLGPGNLGNWFRGCDPKTNQESKERSSSDVIATNSTSTRNHSNSISESHGLPHNLRPQRDLLEKRREPEPSRHDLRSLREPRGNALLHTDWRDKSRIVADHREIPGRFSNLDYDSRPRGSSKSNSFAPNLRTDERRDDRRDRNHNSYSNHQDHRRSGGMNNSYEEATPEWMDEPMSKFEMMDLGGFEDDTRGEDDDRRRSTPDEPSPPPPRHDPTPPPPERSITPEFERLMRDMLKFTEDDMSDIPDVTSTETGSKSSKWFGGDDRHHQPLFSRGHQQLPEVNHSQSNDLIQMLQRARVNPPTSSMPETARFVPHQPVPQSFGGGRQFRTLEDIESSQRQGTTSSEETSEKMAFNKLLDLLQRRGSSSSNSSVNQSPSHVPRPPMATIPGHPMIPPIHHQPQPSEWMARLAQQQVPQRGMHAYEFDEMTQRRKLAEMEERRHLEVLALQQQQQQQQQPRVPSPQDAKMRSSVPAFNMVPIQVIRNATSTDRRGLLPTGEDGQGPRAITGNRGQPRPSYQPEPSYDLQRQIILQNEMRRRAMNPSPVNVAPSVANPFNAPSFSIPARPLLGHQPQTANAPTNIVLPTGRMGSTSLTPQQMFQLNQLQLINQQQHQMNPGVNGPMGRNGPPSAGPGNGGSSGSAPGSALLRSGQ